MGNFHSKQPDAGEQPDLVEQTVFEQPWRQVDWSNREQMLQNLKEILTSPRVDPLRILVVGPAGAGKSAFITSVNTALQGRNTYLAHSLAGRSSATLKYTVYKMKKGTEGSFFPFVFGDTMGLERDNGPHTDEIIDILKGHLPDGYRFNTSEKLTAESNNFNKNPSLNDKVHCLVFVIPSNKICVMKREVAAKLKHVLESSRELGIPQVVVMSKVDYTCPLVREDLKMIYMSKIIKEMSLLSQNTALEVNMTLKYKEMHHYPSVKMYEVNYTLGVPLNYIFPVKNYHEEISPNPEADILILTALTSIVHFSNDFVSRNG